MIILVFLEKLCTLYSFIFQFYFLFTLYTCNFHNVAHAQCMRDSEWTVKQALIYTYLYMHLYLNHVYNFFFEKSGAEFANSRCRILQSLVPNLTGAEFNKCRVCFYSRCRFWQVVLYPFKVSPTFHHRENNELWLYCNNVKLFLFSINVHFPRNGRHFKYKWPFGFYIKNYISETFLMPNKTFVYVFIGLLQEFVLCRCLKIFFSIKSRRSLN